MNNIEIVEYTLPAYWASYLINGDNSGISEKETAKIDKWLEDNGNPWCVGCSDETEFRPVFYDCSNELAGDALTYTFHVR